MFFCTTRVPQKQNVWNVLVSPLFPAAQRFLKVRISAICPNNSETPHILLRSPCCAEDNGQSNKIHKFYLCGALVVQILIGRNPWVRAFFCATRVPHKWDLWIALEFQWCSATQGFSEPEVVGFIGGPCVSLHDKVPHNQSR